MGNRRGHKQRIGRSARVGAAVAGDVAGSVTNTQSGSQYDESGQHWTLYADGSRLPIETLSNQLLVEMSRELSELTKSTSHLQERVETALAGVAETRIKNHSTLALASMALALSVVALVVAIVGISWLSIRL